MDSIAKVERFRQIKSSIRKDPSYLIIGTDVSKGSSMSCLYTHNEGILSSKYLVKHTREGFERFSMMLEHLKNKHPFKEVVIGVEPTGNYHKVFCEYMKNLDYNVVYVSSVAAKNNRKTIGAGRWGKTDPRDAYNIVDLMRQGKIIYYRGESDENVDLRKYLLLRQRLITMKSALQARIRNYLWACYFPELEEIFSTADDPDILTLLEHCPSAEIIRAMSQKSFLKLFPSTINPRTKRYGRIINIWRCAMRSIGYNAHSSVLFESKLIARDMKQIRQDISNVDKILSHFSQSSGAYKQLLTIPGYGPFTTAVFKSTVGDINRFNHSQQIVKLAGIDLELKDSGKFHGHAQISKKGNALFRYALSLAVNVAISRNKQIRAAFLEKLHLHGNTKSARAKLKIKFMEKFIRIAYALLKQNVPFDINYFIVPVREPVQTNVRA
jgi:transposase